MPLDLSHLPVKWASHPTAHPGSPRGFRDKQIGRGHTQDSDLTASKAGQG